MSRYIVFCPSEIITDPNISGNSTKVYLAISNFLKQDGYAFCSNKWLATYLNCKERVIQDYLAELEKYGYLYRELWKEGMYQKRRIWIPSEYALYLLKNNLKDENFEEIQKSYRHARTCVPGTHGCAPSARTDVRPEYKKNLTPKDKNDEGRPSADPEKVPFAVTKKTVAGETVTVTKDDVLRYALANKKKWEITEIELAWTKFARHSYPVTDAYALFEKIIHNEIVKKICDRKEEEKCKQEKNYDPDKMTYQEYLAKVKENSRLYHARKAALEKDMSGQV